MLEFIYEKAFRDLGYRILLMALKKPREKEIFLFKILV